MPHESALSRDLSDCYWRDPTGVRRRDAGPAGSPPRDAPAASGAVAGTGAILQAVAHAPPGRTRSATAAIDDSSQAAGNRASANRFTDLLPPPTSGGVSPRRWSRRPAAWGSSRPEPRARPPFGTSLPAPASLMLDPVHAAALHPASRTSAGPRLCDGADIRGRGDPPQRLIARARLPVDRLLRPPFPMLCAKLLDRRIRAARRPWTARSWLGLGPLASDLSTGAAVNQRPVAPPGYGCLARVSHLHAWQRTPA